MPTAVAARRHHPGQQTSATHGEVQIKDLALGARMSRDIETHEEWREARAAQFSVKEADLVEAVRKALAES